MKGCEEYSVNIQLYFDDEFCCKDLVKFRAHLQECVACGNSLRLSRTVAAASSIKASLHRSPSFARADHERDWRASLLVE
jgi:hypothetical protein